MTAPPVLLVDDELTILRRTSQVLEDQCRVSSVQAMNGTEAFEVLARQPVSLVLLDLGLPDIPGEEVLAGLRKDFPEIPVIMVTALGDLDAAVRCMAAGAYDYVVKGSEPGRLIASVKRALESRKKDQKIAALRKSFQDGQLRYPAHFSDIITANGRMLALFRFIEAVAGSDEPILLQGETGTGKELFARAVHRSSRVTGPFVATNLGGLEDLLVSDTLFGHVKGAYTGADEVRKGLISQASGGTLFLDEIGDLSAQSQVKLLRFLENREYFPLGTDVSRRSEARIVAATNMNLEARAEEGKFRRDLLFRLSAYQIDIPPLRDRVDDLPLLYAHFGVSFSPEAASRLAAYPFPGNVRELRGLVLKAKALSSGPVIDSPTLDNLLPALPKTRAAEPRAEDLPPVLEFPTIRQAVNQLIRDALRKTHGNQSSAARLLGITPQALNKRLKTGETEP